jgi:hydroxymethylpyrimidine pyrophosphatase-like HAD family hydrolase
MLFASDLDQTLIYSEKSFRLLPGEKFPNVGLIETLNGREISFITDRALFMLKEIMENNSFVPVTTRSIEQYRRILLFQEKVIPQFAVVSNGGNILCNNEIDAAWNEHMRCKIQNECAYWADILTKFREIQNPSWCSLEKKVDELFYYCIVDQNKLPHDKIVEFSSWANMGNWQVSLQGRKLYIIPGVLNKWDALVYVRDILNEKFVVAAGDSLLDLCMLEQADYAIVPRHGEIWERAACGNVNAGTLNFTGRAGIFAAEEILEYVKMKFITGKTA